MSAGDMQFPLPPQELLDRVGNPVGNPKVYEDLGRFCADYLRATVPGPRITSGAAVLDFGSGAGRTLRHLGVEAQHADYWGCDIDAPSVDWLNANMSPPFRAVQAEPAPPLPLPTSHFDLVYAFSVFTHISIHWSAWLVELHRLMKPDAWFVATFLGPEFVPLFVPDAGPSYPVGMTVTRAANPWELGGPMVLLSPWWLEAHWGRLFEMVELQASGFGRSLLAKDAPTQGVAIMRPKNVRLTPADLEAPDPSNPLELMALAEAKRISDTELAALASEHHRLADAAARGGAAGDVKRGPRRAWLRRRA